MQSNPGQKATLRFKSEFFSKDVTLLGPDRLIVDDRGTEIDGLMTTDDAQHHFFIPLIDVNALLEWAPEPENDKIVGQDHEFS